MKWKWWYTDELIELIKQVNEDTVDWSEVYRRSGVLKQAAVTSKKFLCAQYHKAMQDYAECNDNVDRYLRPHVISNTVFTLLDNIELNTVWWSDVYVEQHELMITAGEEDNIEGAIFHQKLKNYAEEVFINNSEGIINIPGQTGEE